MKIYRGLLKYEAERFNKDGQKVPPGWTLTVMSDDGVEAKIFGESDAAALINLGERQFPLMILMRD